MRTDERKKTGKMNRNSYWKRKGTDRPLGLTRTGTGDRKKNREWNNNRNRNRDRRNGKGEVGQRGSKRV